MGRLKLRSAVLQPPLPNPDFPEARAEASRYVQTKRAVHKRSVAFHYLLKVIQQFLRILRIQFLNGLGLNRKTLRRRDRRQGAGHKPIIPLSRRGRSHQHRNLPKRGKIGLPQFIGNKRVRSQTPNFDLGRQMKKRKIGAFGRHGQYTYDMWNGRKRRRIDVTLMAK